MLKALRPTADAASLVLDELAERNPKAKEQDPRRIFDDRFVLELQTGGFIDAPYREMSSDISRREIPCVRRLRYNR
jgi:hypothetical protein